MHAGRSTTVAVLTPPGRGAIAVVSIRGPQACEAVDQFFNSASGRSIEHLQSRQIALGRWHGSEGEEVVVCKLDADRIEVHCHGGPLAVRRIVNQLVSVHCREVPWSEDVATETAGQIEASALRALSEASTLRASTILLDQLRGALRREIETLVGLLDDPDRGENRARFSSGLARLQARSEGGLHLTHPWRVVLAGPANVGKSSLVNALLGYERAIVFDQPGTTRDVVATPTAFEGWPVELSDTAGLREADDPLELLGHASTRAILRRADLVVLVSDASSGLTATPVADWPNMLRVWSKCDLVDDCWQPPAGELATSAATGQGIDVLQRAIVDRLVQHAPLPGEALAFRPWQVEGLDQAAQAWAQGDLHAVRERLLSLL